MTWNLKGHADPDVAVVVDHARAMGADVLALQEVQRRQARTIAGGLGAVSLAWGFKHWPVWWPAEGLAIVGLSRPVRVRSHVLSFRARPWSWRRRIFQVAVIGHERPPVVLANVHLSPYAQAALRRREVESMLSTLSSVQGPVIVAGDLNDHPDADFFARFRRAGFRDAWIDRHPGGNPGNSGDAAAGATAIGEAAAGATNWHGWQPGTEEPPHQRLDYVLVSPDIKVVAISVPQVGDEGFAGFANMSDHLPVTATLAVADSSSRTPSPDG